MTRCVVFAGSEHVSPMFGRRGSPADVLTVSPSFGSRGFWMASQPAVESAGENVTVDSLPTVPLHVAAAHCSVTGTLYHKYWAAVYVQGVVK